MIIIGSYATVISQSPKNAAALIFCCFSHSYAFLSEQSKCTFLKLQKEAKKSSGKKNIFISIVVPRKLFDCNLLSIPLTEKQLYHL
jgi:hypothetical protein